MMTKESACYLMSHVTEELFISHAQDLLHATNNLPRSLPCLITQVIQSTRMLDGTTRMHGPNLE